MIPRNEILLQTIFYQFATLFQFHTLSKHIQYNVRKKIHKVYKELQIEGNLFNLTQLTLWAKKFNIPIDSIISVGDYPLPNPKESYSQLNFPLGKLMDFRETYTSSTSPLPSHLLIFARENIDLAKSLGIHPEIWKHLDFIQKQFPEYFSRTDKEERNLYFNYCEYSLLQKTIKSIFHK
jgi:hypothetical protein